MECTGGGLGDGGAVGRGGVAGIGWRVVRAWVWSEEMCSCVVVVSCVSVRGCEVRRRVQVVWSARGVAYVGWGVRCGVCEVVVVCLI